MSDRQVYVDKLRQARQEYKTAGICHKRDLIKHIHRLERELKDYDAYQRASQKR